MPAMTSRTKVCAPKPIATPTTLAPAISGPISTPNSASAIIAATAMTRTNRTLRKIGSSVCSRARRRASSVFGCAEVGGLGELAIDRRLHRMPEEVGDEQDDDGAQHAMGDPCERGVLSGEVNESTPQPQREHCDRADDQKRPDTALEADGR